MKTDPIFECLGDLDELSAVLGLRGDCAWLQTALLDLGSAIAGYAEFKHSPNELAIKLQCNQAAEICRRAERHFAQIENSAPEHGRWLRRLSDQLSEPRPEFQCLADLGELDDCLGDCGEYAWLQSALANLMDDIAGRAEFAYSVAELEAKLKELEERLPQLRNFILPDNKLHLARAICRRVERHYWAMPNAKPEIGKWLNCLSDYLFQEARSKSDGDVRYKQSKGVF